MDKEKIVELRNSIADEICAYLHASIGERLRSLGMTETDILKELDEARKAVNRITCPRACELAHGLNTPAYYACVADCDDK